MTARPVDDAGRRAGDEVTYRAPVVIAADGVSARLALGARHREGRATARWASRSAPTSAPRGTTTRGWSRHLELWDGAPGRSNLLPGYGWIFSLGDGTANVGLGSVSSTAAATKVDYKDLFAAWMAERARRVGVHAREPGRARCAAPRCRWPSTASRSTRSGLMLVGDAGGMVSPFNGEGIAYAHAGRAPVAADVVAQAQARGTAAGARARARARTAQDDGTDLGGYYTLGRVFVQLIEHPAGHARLHPVRAAPTALMRFVLKLLADVLRAPRRRRRRTA